MQDRSAVTIDGASVLARQRQHVMRTALLIFQVQVRERFPSAPQAHHFTAVFRTAIRDFFDNGIESRDIPSASQDTDTLNSHLCSSIRELPWTATVSSASSF